VGQLALSKAVSHLRDLKAEVARYSGSIVSAIIYVPLAIQVADIMIADYDRGQSRPHIRLPLKCLKFVRQGSCGKSGSSKTTCRESPRGNVQQGLDRIRSQFWMIGSKQLNM
jgi:hypothetical protein